MCSTHNTVVVHTPPGGSFECIGCGVHLERFTFRRGTTVDADSPDIQTSVWSWRGKCRDCGVITVTTSTRPKGAPEGVFPTVTSIEEPPYDPNEDPSRSAEEDLAGDEPECQDPNGVPSNRVVKDPDQADTYVVIFRNRLCSPTWTQEGPAQAYLDALVNGTREPEYRM